MGGAVVLGGGGGSITGVEPPRVRVVGARQPSQLPAGLPVRPRGAAANRRPWSRNGPVGPSWKGRAVVLVVVGVAGAGGGARLVRLPGLFSFLPTGVSFE